MEVGHRLEWMEGGKFTATSNGERGQDHNTHHNLKRSKPRGAKKKKKKKWILAKFLQNLGCGAADHSVEGCRWPNRKGKKSVGGQHLR